MRVNYTRGCEGIKHHNQPAIKGLLFYLRHLPVTNLLNSPTKSPTRH